MAGLKNGTKAGSYIIWHSGNDGSGSGLNADTLDGKHASDLMRFNELFLCFSNDQSKSLSGGEGRALGSVLVPSTGTVILNKLIATPLTNNSIPTLHPNLRGRVSRYDQNGNELYRYNLSNNGIEYNNINITVNSGDVLFFIIYNADTSSHTMGIGSTIKAEVIL